MQNITISVNSEEWDRLNRILGPKETAYSFAKDAIMSRLAELEKADPEAAKLPKQIVLDMVEALRGRKWYLYQIADYSDKNHREWLAGRFRKATKNEVADAVAIFRGAIP